MKYTHLEKLLLLGLKDKQKETRPKRWREETTPGPLEALWKIIDAYYGYDDLYKFAPVDTPELLKENILDIAQCSEDELSVTLHLLWQEGLIAYDDMGKTYRIAGLGLRACREIESES